MVSYGERFVGNPLFNWIFRKVMISWQVSSFPRISGFLVSFFECVFRSDVDSFRCLSDRLLSGRPARCLDWFQTE